MVKPQANDILASLARYAKKYKNDTNKNNMCCMCDRPSAARNSETGLCRGPSGIVLTMSEAYGPLTHTSKVWLEFC